MNLAQLRARLMLGAAIGTLILGATGGVAAQEIALEGISIYASASGETDAFAAPGQVSVVDRDRIDDLNPSRLADIFFAVPGVTFEGGPRRSGQVPTIRGFEGEGVVILFDDARQNFVSGHDGRFFIDTDILTAAEVVKGPTSSIYGSGAIGGVLAFRTINADDLLEDNETAFARFKFGYQSVDEEQSYAVTLGHATLDRSADFIGHFGYRASGDIALGSGDTLPADDELKNALVKGTFRLGDGFTSTTSWIFTRLDAVDPQNPQGANVAGSDNALVAREATSSTLQTKLEYNPSGNDLLDGRIVVYRTLNDVVEPEVESNRVTGRKVVTLGFKADNTSRFSLGPATTVKFTYGTDIYRDEQVGSDSATTGGTRGGVPNATSNFAGLFAEAELVIGRPGNGLGELTLVPGVRFDSFSSESDIADDIDETAVSPKIAVRYSPNDWFSLFGNYGKAFRAPSYNEAYSIGQHFVIPVGPGVFAPNNFIPNPDLQPETAVGWEAGASFKFAGMLTTDDSLKIKGSYLRSDVEDLIELDVITAFSPTCFFPPFAPCTSGTSQHVNVANAELDGVEVEAVYDSRHFFLKTAYSQIDGRDVDTGEFAGNLFPNRLFFDAAVKFPDWATKLGARATFASDFTKEDDPAEFRDAYRVFDLYAVWQPTEGALKGVRLDLGVDNVADEDYEVVAAGVSEEGRNYKMAVSYRLPLCGAGAC